MTDDQGNAYPMTLYLPSPKDKAKLRKYLDRVFPEATHKTWEGEFSSKRDQGKTQQAKTKILDCLDALEELEGHVGRVSSRSLRKTFPELQEFPPSTYRNAVSELKVCPERNWTVEAQSFVRIFP
jgi:hypothetical protein